MKREEKLESKETKLTLESEFNDKSSLTQMNDLPSIWYN
jgi:hypothetical protein